MSKGPKRFSATPSRGGPGGRSRVLDGIPWAAALSLAALGCSGLRTPGNRWSADPALFARPVGAVSRSVDDPIEEPLEPGAVLPETDPEPERPVPAEPEPGAVPPGQSVPEALPTGFVFKPLIADMKEPQFSLAYHHVRFRGQALPAEGDSEINAGLVSLGGTFDFWRRTEPEWDFAAQVGVFGAVFSQFNLDLPSTDLINSDYQVGLPLTLRWGMFSSRLRFFHQSSHLGDEFLLRNPGVDREDLSFETVDGLLAVGGKWGRVYGGGGYVVRSESELDRGLLQWGVEFVGPSLRWEGSGANRLRPLLAADFNSIEERDWDVTTSLKGGVELKGAKGARGVRVLGVYLNGFIPFGQFFNTEKIESFGVELQFLF